MIESIGVVVVLFGGSFGFGYITAAVLHIVVDKW
jgi:hypothetical protein